MGTPHIKNDFFAEGLHTRECRREFFVTTCGHQKPSNECSEEVVKTFLIWGVPILKGSKRLQKLRLILYVFPIAQPGRVWFRSCSTNVPPRRMQYLRWLRS